MPVILVANSKGGVGKSTVASNLAGFYAGCGERTMLGDLDRQQTARGWLRLRPPSAAAITSWEFDERAVAKPPRGVTHIVLDTPAGINGSELRDAVRIAAKIIVPLQASLFDIEATHAFLGKLAEQGASIANGRVALVATRADPRTRAAQQLDRYVQQTRAPFLGFLRDAQIYVQLAAQGLTLWDVAPARVQQDIEQWAPIIHWISEGRRAV
ncbi:MAG TPA: ParA family protein [Burkholderiaceae bacterium]|nr:ParA family protein [Burkholderiaceae bacterium]